jgi:acetyltransferase-like isoleucine patch superfamily enzyme
MIMAPALAAIIIGNGLIEGRGAVIVPGEVAAGNGATVG